MHEVLGAFDDALDEDLSEIRHDRTVPPGTDTRITVIGRPGREEAEWLVVLRGGKGS